MINLNNNQHGFAILAVIFILTLAVMMAVNGTAMFVNQTISAINEQFMVEDHSIAISATEFIVKIVTDHWTDWTNSIAIGEQNIDPEAPDEADRTLEFSLGRGSFDAVFSNVTERRMDVRIVADTEQFNGIMGQGDDDDDSDSDQEFIRRTYEFSIWKQPKSLQFGLFVNNSGVASQDLTIDTTSTVNGNVYNKGDITADGAGVVFNGFAYVHNSGATVAPSNIKKVVAVEPADLPALDLSFYEDLITGTGGYEFDIPTTGTCSGTEVYSGPNPMILNGGVRNTVGNACNLVIFPGITIQGQGRIAAEGFIQFGGGGSSETVVAPGGWDIVFIARDYFLVTGAAVDFRSDPGAGRVVIYARDDPSATVFIDGTAGVKGDDVLILSRRNVTFRSLGTLSDIFESTTLAFDQAGATCETNGIGCVISVDANSHIFGTTLSEDAIRLRVGAVVRGLVYAAGLSTSGANALFFDTGATVRGSAITSEISNDIIDDGHVNADQSQLPGVKPGTSMPSVFLLSDPQVMPWVVPNSWKQKDDGGFMM